MIKLDNICLYPIKSILGIEVDQIEAFQDGLKMDRFAMLVDNKNKFLSQKEYPILSQFSISLTDNEIIVKYENDSLAIYPEDWTNEQLITGMWEDSVSCNIASQSINEWFSSKLGFGVRLQKKATKYSRIRDFDEYTNTPVTLTNSHPYHLLSQSSMDQLNEKIGHKLNINRFRPNFIVSGLKPHEEDDIDTIRIGDAVFKNVSRCFRCAVTTVDQETGLRSKEPLKTLNSYRNFEGKILFGIQLICLKKGMISINDEIKIEFK